MNISNKERLLKIILGSHISEKATFIAEKNNQTTFKVVNDATKKEIKEAIELIWKEQKVEVISVKTINVKGKRKRFGKYFGKRNDWKKAMVNIKAGQELNFSNIPNLGIE